MNFAGWLQLLVLGAIWGASFLFQRVAVPVVGASSAVSSRLLLGALFLLMACVVSGVAMDWRTRWRGYLVLGFINTALPFLLFGLAARQLPAGMLAILNSTATFWGTALQAAWLRRWPGPLALVGLVLGVGGVAVLVGFDASTLGPGSALGMVFGVAAGLCYGIGSSYARFSAPVPALANASGSVTAAAVMVLPALWWDPPHELAPGAGIFAALLALGLMCSGLAYLIYFRLLHRYGAPQVLTVAFLIPLFGVFWGWLFLHEPVGLNTLLGAPMVLLGTRLVAKG